MLPKIDYIPQGVSVEVYGTEKNIMGHISEADSFDLGALIPRSAQRSFKVIIRYENTENDLYETEGTLGEKAFTFEKLTKLP